MATDTDANIPIRFPLVELRKLDDATDLLGGISRARYVRACLRYIQALGEPEAAVAPHIPPRGPLGRAKRWGASKPVPDASSPSSDGGSPNT